MLVTPPYLGPEWSERPLPFRSIVVASHDDPYSTMAEFAAYAQGWGSELVDAGAVGHLDGKTGFGPWPAAAELITRLVGP